MMEIENIIKQIRTESKKIIVGQDDVIEKMLICIIADGHILLEGVPGIAKTLSARVLSRIIDCDFNRIQFTPDLMPADIIGTSIFNMNTSTFSFVKGPIFSNIVLIDEINRSPAKTQSALFEVMEEKQVSYNSETYHMDTPFLVIATQNPVEQEGTYRLPEAQLDRFMMKIKLDYPSLEEEVSILHKFKNDIGKVDIAQVEPVLSTDMLQGIRSMAKEIVVEEDIINYIAAIVHKTRNHGSIYLGASPRASLNILRASKATALLAGRDFIIPDDVQYVAPDILNHRILLSPDAEVVGMDNDTVVADIIKEVEVPR